MGGLLSSMGASNNFQASNPYSPQQLQTELGQQQQIYGQQQSLGQALQQQAAGAGPNPAQTQYQGNVQNNIANAQGLIASQRGLNPALAARMGVNAATNANSQAANFGATLQAQQQLAAQQQLGSLYGQEQQGNLGAQQLYTGAQGSANQINAGVQGQNAQIVGSTIGGVLNAVGGAGAAVAGKKAKGGIIEGKAKVSGNSYANDTVPAMLSPGEGVIDREHMTSREKAHEKVDEMFDHHDKSKTSELAQHLAKSKKPKTDYKDVLAARRKKAA